MSEKKRFQAMRDLILPSSDPQERSQLSSDLRFEAQRTWMRAEVDAVRSHEKRQAERARSDLGLAPASAWPVSSSVPSPVDSPMTPMNSSPEGISLVQAIVTLRGQIEDAQKAKKGGGFFSIEYIDLELEVMAEKSKITEGSVDWLVGYSRSKEEKGGFRHKLAMRLKIKAGGDDGAVGGSVP